MSEKPSIDVARSDLVSNVNGLKRGQYLYHCSSMVALSHSFNFISDFYFF